jgi:dTMP kinase
MFITLEGIEGSGKSTQLRHIEAFCKQRGRAVTVTREPGGTAIGEAIRAILLNPENRRMEPLTEMLLYEADRAEHVRKKILPALADGRVVLCDRFYDATVVYQGYGRDLDLEMIHRIHRTILGQIKPDVTFLFDLAPEAGLQRAWSQINTGHRSGTETRFENEALAFHRKIRDGYLTVARLEPERFCIVDAARDEDTVRQAVLEQLEKILEKE